jgi:hypothetical protein
MTFDEIVESFKKLNEQEQRKAINDLAQEATIKARELGFLKEDESVFGIEEPKEPDESATQS